MTASAENSCDEVCPLSTHAPVPEVNKPSVRTWCKVGSGTGRTAAIQGSLVTLLTVSSGLTFLPHSVFMSFIWIREQRLYASRLLFRPTISLYWDKHSPGRRCRCFNVNACDSCRNGEAIVAPETRRTESIERQFVIPYTQTQYYHHLHHHHHILATRANDGCRCVCR